MNKPTTNASLVFIAGLGHSGSTLLDLLLGVQSGVSGLGEIDVFLNNEKNDWFLKRFNKYPCTCGKTPSKCAVWGDFEEYIKDDSKFIYAEKYARLFNLAVSKTGSSIIVDSSKHLSALKSVRNSLSEIGLSSDHFFVIHLVKDVRNFTTSSILSDRNSNIMKNFRLWKKANLKIEKYLKAENINTMQVGYDELTLSTKVLMERIFKFITGSSQQKISLDLTRTHSHIISGNNMRLDNADDIRYDYRWFNQRAINLHYLFYPGVRKLNKRWVYSNVQQFLGKKGKFEPPQSNI